MRRPRPASRGMRPLPIPREAGTCVSRDVAGGNDRTTVVRLAGGARVTKEDRVYLGRVVDRTWGLPESGARMFPYDLATGGLASVPRERNARAAGTALAVSLGDAFLLVFLLLCSGGMMACADVCDHAEPDTVRAPLAPCVLAGLANRHVEDWWRPPLREAPLPQGSAARAPSVALWASVCASSAGAARPTASPLTPRGHPTLAAFPSRPSATTTVRPARRSASPAPCRGTRACPPLPPRRRQRDRREHGHQDYRCAWGNVCFGPRFPPQSHLFKTT